jgi:hypothetical protein
MAASARKAEKAMNKYRVHVVMDMTFEVDAGQRGRRGRVVSEMTEWREHINVERVEQIGGERSEG